MFREHSGIRLSGIRETANFEVTFTIGDDDALGEWTFGSLSWLSLGRLTVRGPIALRPAPISTPAAVSDTGTDDNIAPNVPAAATVDSSGNVSVQWTGLAPGTRALGILEHSDGNEPFAQTEVMINTQ